MIRVRWLALLCVSMLVAGCIAELPPCHDPGTQFSKSCFYKLTVLDAIERDNTVEVTGTVPQQAVEQNATRWMWQRMPMIGPDFELKDYEYVRYTFFVPEWKGAASDKKGNSYEFCNVPNSRDLRLAPPLSGAADTQQERCPQTKKSSQMMGMKEVP